MGLASALGSRRLERHVSAGDAPTDLRDLIYKSDLIIQGHVKSVADSRYATPGRQDSIETDFEVVVNRIFKAKRDTKTDDLKKSHRIVVSQIGGRIGGFEEVPAEYQLMIPGENYILFLKYDNRPHLSIGNDLRCVIAGTWHGAFQIDEQDILKVSEYSNFRAFNDQKKHKDDFIVEILNTYHKWMKNDKVENN